jgi:hypothetical protein
MDLARHFKDKDGNIVIAHRPNKPLWAGLIFFVMGYLPNSTLQDISFLGFIFSLLYWSYLEIFYGVNLWRRFLGLLILIGIVYRLRLFIQ